MSMCPIYRLCMVSNRLPSALTRTGTLAEQSLSPAIVRSCREVSTKVTQWPDGVMGLQRHIQPIDTNRIYPKRKEKKRNTKTSGTILTGYCYIPVEPNTARLCDHDHCVTEKRRVTVHDMTPLRRFRPGDYLCATCLTADLGMTFKASRLDFWTSRIDKIRCRNRLQHISHRPDCVIERLICRSSMNPETAYWMHVQLSTETAHANASSPSPSLVH